MILDEKGTPLLLPSVRSATEQWASEALLNGFPYPPLLGLPAFRSSVSRLIFGEEQLIASIAATGGTGALALNVKLLKLMGIRRVVLPVPSWPNHLRMLRANDMEVIDVPFLEDGEPSIAALLDVAEKADHPLGFLLQENCHNPTGKKWQASDLEHLADALRRKNHIVLVDCAYQGLGEGVEEDISMISMLRAASVGLLVSWSASKNHTMYGLRTGLAAACAQNEDEKETIEGHYRILTREMHSASPTPGQHIVSLVQENFAEDWRHDLATLRRDLHRRRTHLIETFPQWQKCLEGVGLYAVLPIEPHSIRALREKHIFLTDDGRVNLAGIPLCRLEEFTEALHILA